MARSVVNASVWKDGKSSSLTIAARDQSFRSGAFQSARESSKAKLSGFGALCAVTAPSLHFVRPGKAGIKVVNPFNTGLAFAEGQQGS